MIKGQIKFPDPLSHEMEIELIFPASGRDKIELFLPLWRPGRYEAADFVRNISGISVDSRDSSASKISRLSSNRWSVDTSNEDAIKIYYRYYANKMDAGNSVVDEELIYINFVNCILTSQEYLDVPIRLVLDIPTEYTSACSLDPTGGILEAANYHELVDSPLIASETLKVLDYSSHGSKFQIAIQGNAPIEDQMIVDDFKKFTDDQIEKMGGFPTDRYLFIIHSLDYKHYHGVEHQNSTVLVLGPNTDDVKDQYREDLLGVASHELFHTWNVTRIRPKEMSPYNYRDEINFGTGVVAEGFTTYFGDWFLKTSGVFSPKEYLNELNKLCARHFDNFGRHRTSLLESSMRLWIDGYKNSMPSRKVSIYVKGALVSLILDLEIRKLTNSKKSLLTVVEEMFEDFTFEKGGYDWHDIKQIFSSIHVSISDLAEHLVESTEPIEDRLESALDYAGLKTVSIPHKNPLTALSGIKLEENRISDLYPLSPMAQMLCIGDRLLEINNTPFEQKDVLDDISKIKIKRNEKIEEFDVNMNEPLEGLAFEIRLNESASKSQIAFRNRWIGK